MKRILIVGCASLVLMSSSLFGDDANLSIAKNIGVLATGQVKSYDSSGSEVLDGSLKDDGFYKSSIVKSYTRDGSLEIVHDNITGLIWEDSNNIEKYYYYPDAQDYCENLVIGSFSEWRLPTLLEAYSISDPSGAYNEPYLPPVFQNIGESTQDSIWTANKSWSSVGWNAWTVRFNQNHAYETQLQGYNDYVNAQNKVRCVHGEKLNSTPDYVRDNTNNIVIDKQTGLYWQDDGALNAQNIYSLSWNEAINYCEDLALGGYDDWRLPNINELFSIVEIPEEEQYYQGEKLNTIFQYTYQYDRVWSSTSIAQEEYLTANNIHESAFGVDFMDGTLSMDQWKGDFGGMNTARCVRGGVGFELNITVPIDTNVTDTNQTTEENNITTPPITPSTDLYFPNG